MRVTLRAYLANIANSSRPSRRPITWMRQLLNEHSVPDVAPRDLYSTAPALCSTMSGHMTHGPVPISLCFLCACMFVLLLVHALASAYRRKRPSRFRIRKIVSRFIVAADDSGNFSCTRSFSSFDSYVYVCMCGFARENARGSIGCQWPRRRWRPTKARTVRVFNYFRVTGYLKNRGG